MTPAASSFSFEPLFLAIPVVAAFAYVHAVRHDRPTRARAISFGTALVLVAASLNSPLETISAHYLLLAHLTQNALVADLAPPLALLGLTPNMRRALALRGGRGLALVTRARVALPLWLVVWYATHAAPFYEWALRSGWGLNVEHALLIAAGLVFWWPLVSGRLSIPAALGYLAAGFVGSAFLGLAYIFSSSAFYSFYKHAPRLLGLSPARDQNLGGVVMNAEQTLVFLTAIGYYVWRLLEEEHITGSSGGGSRAGG